MYHAFFGLRQPPFAQRVDPAEFVHNERLLGLVEALTGFLKRGDGVVKVTGRAGVGKSMLARMLVELAGRELRIACLSANSCAPKALLHAACVALGLPQAPHAASASLIQNLVKHIGALRKKGVKTALIIDECEWADPECLEQLRMVGDQLFEEQRLLPLMLCGRPELDRLLVHPTLRALRSRIVHALALEPLSRDEVSDYLALRMRRAGYYGPDLFPKPVARAIARFGHGLPRHINLLAHEVLLSAFAAGTYDLSRHQVRAAADALARQSISTRAPPPVAAGA